jgi:DNA-binding SARP family transcriptional activator
VDFRILGPLYVSREGRELRLGGHQQKVLVCLLLLHANEVVSAERIIDALWGEAAPATARKALQVSMSRLRQVLGAGVLETHTPGYLIRVQNGEFDAHRFEGLVAQGKHALTTGEPGRAAALLRTALALWRGPALADAAYESFAQAAARRLEELRLTRLRHRRHRLPTCQPAALLGTSATPHRRRKGGTVSVATQPAGRPGCSQASLDHVEQALFDGVGLGVVEAAQGPVDEQHGEAMHC